MATRWKVYRGKELLASCKYAEDAAAILALHEGSTLHFLNSKALWREGAESQPAGDSYDYVSQVAHERLKNGLPADRHDLRHGARP